MRKSDILFYLLIPSLVVTSVFTGYTYRKVVEQEQLEEVIAWNTKQIQSLGVAATIQSTNAEYIIQILNVLEDRADKPVEFTQLSQDQSESKEEVLVTFEQVNKDQREVDLGIRAFASNELFQAEALDNVLSILKGKQNESVAFSFALED